MIYRLGESTVLFRGLRSNFKYISIPFFNEIRLNKWYSPRWDATEPVAIYCLHNYVPQKGCQAYMS